MRSTYIVPVFGAIYEMESGGRYRCVDRRLTHRVDPTPSGDLVARFRRLSDGWTFEAGGIRQNEDGTICWAWAKNGKYLPDRLIWDAAEFAVTEDEVAQARACMAATALDGPTVAYLTGALNRRLAEINQDGR